ncbi:MAG: zinc-binding dehydrogenase, partial [Candidatus Bathyarchaeia archaeon]
DVVERIRALTPGERGPDIVIEAAGSVDTIRQSLEMVAKVGRVVLFGACGENPTLDTTSLIVYKEIDVMGMTGRYMYGTWNKVERMVSDGKINLRSVVTHRLPLAEADKGFQLLVKGDASKIVLSP